MWRRLANLMKRFDCARYRRGIDRALALHMRREARRAGLTLKRLSHRLEIEWCAREIHPWDRNKPEHERASLYSQQSLADTESAITRLFEAMPQVDVIDVTVREHDSENVIMAGSVDRSAAGGDPGLSVGMRLWNRGITYHWDGYQFEPLSLSDHAQRVVRQKADLMTTR